MNYPFANADWFSQALPRTSLYRRVRAGLLTLGHLRTAEALNLPVVTGGNALAMHWGLLISISQSDWRKARLRASKCGLLWLLRRDYNAPRNYAELKACFDWWKSQNYFPTRIKEASEQSTPPAINRASTTIERLALSVAQVDGWQAVSGFNSVWDIPMVTATHLLVAKAEMDGASHIPYDLIKEALSNGKIAVGT